MRRAARPLLVLIVLAACGPKAAPPPTVPPPSAVATATTAPPVPEATGPKARQLEADAELTRPSGARFKVAKGWWVLEGVGGVQLEDPDRELRLSLLEVRSLDPVEALAAAWRTVRPDFARAVKDTIKPPPRDGWDDITQQTYETTADEQRAVVGIARRKGEVQYVALLDAKLAALDRRGAQMALVLTSLRVPGQEEESLAGRPAAPFDAPLQAQLAAFIEAAMAKAQVPGAAMAVVQGGKLAWAQGFGVRELGKKERVTPKTLFMIGSTTKSLTTLMMAKLVDEGRFGWDTPVLALMPDFALADPAATAQMAVKHTVCACTGLPRQDMELLFEYSGATPESRVGSMRAMKPTTGFGETFQYSNTMVSTGGYLAGLAAFPGRKLGPAYDEAMSQKLFFPVGMRATTFDPRLAAKREHASPHMMDLGQHYAVGRIDWEGGVLAVRPAGAAWSNAEDMARYLLVELARGKTPEGKDFVSEAAITARWAPQVKITADLAYGLGLLLESGHGLKIIGHGGNNLGFSSDMYFFPDFGVGVVLLTNGGGANAFRGAVKRRMIELLFGARDEAAKNLEFGLARAKEAAEKERAKLVLDAEPAVFQPYLGDYVNDALGKLQVQAAGKKLLIDAGEWKAGAALKKEADGTYSFEIVEPPLAGIELRLKQEGDKRTLRLELPQQTYVFEPAR